MRLLSVPLLLAVFLASCGGSGSSESCAQSFWDGEIGTCLPDGWTVADEQVLSERGVPPETVVVFQRDEAVAGQFPTVVVTREALGGTVTADEYSEASIKSVALLPSYEEVDSRALKQGDITYTLHIFTAQPITGEPTRRFYQVSTVSPEGDGYTMTALTPLAVAKDLESDILTILSHLNFTDPDATEE